MSVKTTQGTEYGFLASFQTIPLPLSSFARNAKRSISTIFNTM